MLLYRTVWIRRTIASSPECRWANISSRAMMERRKSFQHQLPVNWVSSLCVKNAPILGELDRWRHYAAAAADARGPVLFNWRAESLCILYRVYLCTMELSAGCCRWCWLLLSLLTFAGRLFSDARHLQDSPHLGLARGTYLRSHRPPQQRLLLCELELWPLTLIFEIDHDIIAMWSELVLPSISVKSCLVHKLLSARTHARTHKHTPDLLLYLNH